MDWVIFSIWYSVVWAAVVIIIVIWRLKKLPSFVAYVMLSFSVLLAWVIFIGLLSSEPSVQANVAVAIGTILLALFTFIATDTSRKASKESQHISEELLKTNIRLVNQIRATRVLDATKTHSNDLRDVIDKWIENVKSAQLSTNPFDDVTVASTVERHWLYDDLSRSHSPSDFDLGSKWDEFKAACIEHQRIKKEAISTIDREFQDVSGIGFQDPLNSEPWKSGCTMEYGKGLIEFAFSRHRDAIAGRAIPEDEKVTAGNDEVSWVSKTLIRPVDMSDMDLRRILISQVESLGSNSRIRTVFRKFDQKHTETMSMKEALTVRLREMRSLTVLPGECEYIKKLVSVGES